MDILEPGTYPILIGVELGFVVGINTVPRSIGHYTWKAGCRVQHVRARVTVGWWSSGCR